MGAPKTAEGRQHRLDILDFCQEYRSEHGYFPTREVICDELGMSVGSFTHHARSLVKQGFILYEPGAFARTLRLTRKQRRFLE